MDFFPFGGRVIGYHTQTQGASNGGPRRYCYAGDVGTVDGGGGTYN